MNEPALWRRLVAEGLGSAFLAALVVALALPPNYSRRATSDSNSSRTRRRRQLGLFAIISMFGGVSGAHFNPVVSFVDAAFGGLRWRDAAATSRPSCRMHRWSDCCERNVSLRARQLLYENTVRPGPTFFPRSWRRWGCSWSSLPWLVPSGATPPQPQWAPTSVRRTSSPVRQASPILRLRLAACSLIRSLGFNRRQRRLYIAAEVIGGILAVLVIKTLYPDVTPAEAADIVFPHHGAADVGNAMTATPSASNGAQAHGSCPTLVDQNKER